MTAQNMTVPASVQAVPSPPPVAYPAGITERGLTMLRRIDG